VLLVAPVTQLIRGLRAVTSIGIALVLGALSVLAIALSPWLQSWAGASVTALALHPVTLMVAIGAGLQGLAECFLSPRYLEYASKQAPKGEEGLYMGFSHLNTMVAWLVGFALSGYLIDSFCPDPTTLPPDQHAQWLTALAGGGPMPAAYDRAHWIWYVYAAIGAAAFLGLLVFRAVTDRIDRRRAATEAAAATDAAGG